MDMSLGYESWTVVTKKILSNINKGFTSRCFVHMINVPFVDISIILISHTSNIDMIEKDRWKWSYYDEKYS
jgi:hypothetical protein